MPSIQPRIAEPARSRWPSTQAAILSPVTRRWQPCSAFWKFVASSFLLFLLSCRPAEAPRGGAPPTPKPVRLKLLVVDDPGLAQEIERQWNARGSGELTVEAIERKRLETMRRLPADMIVFPSRLLGRLAVEGLIGPWPTSGEGAGRSDPDVFPLQRFREMRWGATWYAVTFGSPQFVLYLRNDRLEALRREVPSTWDAYAELAGQLHREAQSKAAGAPPFALAEPLGPGWAAPVFLARAASYIGHASQYSGLFDFTSMEPLVNEPPFVQALEELVAAAKLAPPEVLDADPPTVKRWFYEGKVAMAWGWPTRTFDIAAEVDKPIDVDVVSFARLPGSRRAYLFGQNAWESRGSRDDPHVPLLGTAGRLGAVVRGTSRRQEAAAALAWLSGREIGVTVSTASPATTPYRASHRADARWLDQGLPDVLATQYGELVQQNQSQGTALFAPRIPGASRYLSALDDAVRRAVREEIPAKECLDEVARQWADITRELGKDAQVEAYHRSLGLRR